MLSKNRVWTVRLQHSTLKLFLRTFIFLSVFSLSFINKTNAPGAPAPQVVTELHFDEGSGTTVADASGSGHNATLVNGPTWGAGKYGQGINLDGTNDYVNIPDHADYTLNPAQSYTWSGWVRNNNFNQWSTVWSQTINTSNYFYFYAHSSTDADAGPVTNGISVHWYNGNNKLAMHSNNNVLTAGQWSYIAITYDASKAQASRFTIYVNGADVSNRSDVVSAGTIATLDPTNIRIGSNQPYGEYLNGSVDEVRYYRRLLSVAEIQSDMNAGNTGDTTPPSVNITAPGAGTVSGTINVTADASDNVGVAGVQFLLDGVALGAEDITAPYSVSWNTTTATNGNHNLTARARDAAGNTTTSATVVVNVNNAPPDTQAPTVTVIAPPPGTVSGTINVDATATDNVAVVGVQFLLDGANLGTEDVTAPYSVSWITTGTINGPHTLTAKARDAAGNNTTSAPISVTVNNNNLVAAYGFNENAGITANDNSGNNNTGTLTNGPTWSASGKFGAAILFDGTNDLVNINNSSSLNLTNGMTIEAWVNPSNLTGYKTVICKENGASNLSYALSANNSTSGSSNQRPDSRIRIGSNTRTVTGSSKLALNTWTHIASTYDGTTVRLYVNGVQVSSLATTGNITTTTDLLRIGGSPALGTQYFAGLIDEVRIYNRALTQAQIQTDMNTPVAPDVTNPTVNITAPAAGNVSAAINVTANAADNIAVTGVQFLLDGANLGAEDVTAPYSVSWNTISTSNGNHTLTARARDAAGNTTTSTSVIVTVNNDTELPTVTLTAPTAGTVSGNVDLNANATDNIGVVGVQFLLNGANLGVEDLTAPYSVTWNALGVANGTYTLTARARDAAGNIATSAGVIVTVNNPQDTEAPIVTLTAPAAGNVSGTINVTATATDNTGVVGVQFLLDGNNLGAEDLTAPYSVSWNTTGIANGSHTLTARARDAAGNPGVSTDLIVTVNNDITPPTVAITSPASGNVSGTISVSANASDNIAVTGVQFLLDGNNLGTEVVTAPYSISWNTASAGNGPHTLTARARDAAGNTTTSAVINVTVNNSGSGIQLVQKNMNGVENSVSNMSVAFTSANTAGNFLIVSASVARPARTLTISDTRGNTYIPVMGPVNDPVQDVNLYIWYVPSAIAGANTVTITPAGSSALEIHVSEWSGMPANAVVDQTSSAMGTSLAISSGAKTTTADGELIFGFAWIVNSASSTAAFTPLSFINGDLDEYQIQPTAGSVATTFTQTITGQWLALMATFKSPDTQAPTVSLNSPVNNQNVSGTINVTATASDNIAVAGVQFLVDGTTIGSEVTTAPYTVSWNSSTVTNGNHTLTARARDGGGNITTSTGVIVSVTNAVDSELPTVAITAPAAGNVSGTINVTANASDNIGVVGVQFLLDGVNLGAEDLTAPYSISWNTLTSFNGPHILTAKARDAAGNIGASSTVTVNINNAAAPANLVAALSFNEGAGINAADVSGNNHNGSVNGATWGAGKYGQALNFNGTSNYVNIADHADFTLDPTQNYTWSAWVKSNNFGQWQTIWSQTIDVNNFFYFYAHSSTDAEAGPVTNGISLYWWTGGGTNKVVMHSNNNVLTAGQWSHVTITYNGSLAQNSRFTIYVNGTDVTNRTDVVSVGTLASINPTNIHIGSNQPWGEYLNGAIDEVRYYKRLLTPAEITTDMNTPIGNDATPPTVNITNPSNNSSVTGTISVTANAADNIGVAGVQFLLDGINLGAEDLTAPYSISWNSATATNGPHILTARVRDVAGNTTTSTDVNITTTNDTELPTVTLTAPGAGTVLGTFDITADAADNTGVVGVQFLLNGANLGAEDLTAPYAFTWNTNTVTDGSYTLTAKARDATGNVTISTPVVVNVMNHPPDTEFPAIAITAPSAGEVLGNINVTANASDNVGVVGVQFLLNGIALGAEDITAPYSVPWNTLSVTNGSYTITAKARDLAGNITTSDPVVVTVNNPPDTQSPTVNITAPAAGNVNGTINVTANASDNAAVAGVQFLLDGNNLGAEDVAAPYSVTFNTGLVANGPHVLSARARDAAGNSTLAANVNINVVISNPPAITAITVNPITLSSAVINWTTNVPANSKINFGTNTSYGLSTLADSTLVTTHSQTLNGLAPATLYHYQITSGDLNGTVATSADNNFTSSSLPASIGNLNGHSVFADATGKLIPWTPNPTDGYSTVIGLSFNFLLNSVPNDPSTGKPAYYSRSYLNSNTQAVVDWPHNPAGLYSMLTESALKYYGYTGNVAFMQLVENVATWHLDHGMTSATDNWPSVPYASGDAGSVNYDGANMGNSTGQGDGDGFIEPDKIGELGNAWLQLYKYDGNVRYRDAAIQAGNILSSKVRAGSISQSPWPFRVNAHTGAIREDYCGDAIGPITLLDNLIATGLGDTAAYRVARTTAWNWLMAFPMQNNVWTQYFEDSPIETPYNVNINNYDAMMTARYLLMHPEFDANWEAHVRALITWDETKFGQTSFGAMAIKEQLHFSFIMGSHTSRYASVNALLYERTGDLAAKEKAYRSFNWATYMAKTTGVVIDGPDVNNQWFTDGYGDYVRHFMTGMGAVPEWSPFNQTHFLRSSSVLKNITYGTNSVSYTTYDGTATDVLHVNFNPVTVTANGVPLPQRSDLNQPGWTLDVNTKALRIYHVGATQIIISASATPPGGRMQEVNTLYY
jgi:hypothetical protein